jgi:hypothetical protein
MKFLSVVLDVEPEIVVEEVCRRVRVGRRCSLMKITRTVLGDSRYGKSEEVIETHFVRDASNVNHPALRLATHKDSILARQMPPLPAIKYISLRDLETCLFQVPLDFSH